MPEQEYRGKIAIVTGAAQGIGAAVVLALSRDGAIVAALDIQAERLALCRVSGQGPGRAGLSGGYVQQPGYCRGRGAD